MATIVEKATAELRASLTAVSAESPYCEEHQAHPMAVGSCPTCLFKIAQSKSNQLAEVSRRLMWQPIETAPKDGTRLLLARRQVMSGELTVVSGHWSCGDSYNMPHWSTLIGMHEPTHWMPLPASPNASDAERAVTSDVPLGHQAVISQLRTELGEVSRRLAQVTTALERYGEHTKNCETWENTLDPKLNRQCTCGFNDLALSAPETEERGAGSRPRRQDEER